MKKPGILFVSLLCAVMFFMSCEKTVITDTMPPAPVTELKASAENGKIILTWKDPSDSDLLGIKIYNGKEQARAVSLSDGILVGKGIQKYEVMGLENEKIYTFKVSAVDKALNESKTVETGKIIFIEKTLKTVYVCPNCEKTYETAKEAADCCGVKIIEKKVTHYAFVCPNCMEEYLSPQAAAACCGVKTVEVEKIVKKYLCPRDGKEYDKAEDAENCCGPVINTEIKYVCPKDYKEYTTAQEAADCCGVQIVEVEKPVYKYICPNDHQEFETAEEAADCCGVQIEYVDREVETIVTKYVCPRDGREYNTVQEAENCCGAEIKYVCPKDFKEYETAEEAANCCGVQTVEVEKIVYKYVCPNDQKEYETAEEAAACCGVQIEYVDREVEKIVYKYVCPKDQKEYTTAQEAADCCGVQTVEVINTVYKYICPKDQKEYATAQEAAECCGVQIEYVDREVEKEVKKYVCPQDNKEYATAQQAAACCGPVEVEKLVYTTGIAEAGTYTICHLQQNTSGGKEIADYTLADKETNKVVAAESTIAVLGKTYTGFTAKAMALNETVIYVFYDRNTITYTFNTGNEGKFSDGTTSKTVSGLYGSSVSLPAAPVGNDIIFVGWKAGNQEVSSTFGAEDKTYNAQWNVDSLLIAKSKEMVSVITESTTITGDQTEGVFLSGRTVTLSPYSIGKYEVTQILYESVMGTNPSYFSSDSAEEETQELRPVDNINWYRAIAFCNKLSLRVGYDLCYSVKDSEGNEIDWANLVHSDIPTSNSSLWNAAVCDMTKNGYRLPTEAEWEFAARGGNQSAVDWNYTYSGSDTISDVAWYYFNSNEETHEVETKAANRLGIYDMSGNVWEWCNDWYTDSISTSETVIDTAGLASGSGRDLRGGCYSFIGYFGGQDCTVSYRTSNDPCYYNVFCGFRLARSADNWKEEHDKAISKNTPAIGKIVMSDGSYQESSTYSSYNGTATPVGVVCKVNDDGQTGLMIGLCNSSSGTNSGYKQWAPSSFTGYDTKFTAIQCSQGGNAGSYTITGDTNGSDNWAEICKVDADETLNPATYYPAFNYALKYATTAGLTGTEYADGWYMPSAYELFYYVYQNKTILNSSISSAGGTILANDIYWSSSQDSYETEYAWTVSFGNGGAGSDPKTDGGYVCCLRAFGEEETFSDHTKETAEIGDITLSNGRFISSENYSSYTGTATPVGIVCKVNDDGKTGLMLGLNSSSGTNSGNKKWAPSGTTGYSTNFTAIQGTTSGGDTDGSDNWEEICKVDTEGTAESGTNYPAFNYALTYAETAGLTETEYADGWYMPTVYELYNYVYQNRTALNESLTAAGGTTLRSAHYWSSSQDYDTYYGAWTVYFDNGNVANNVKHNGKYVCCLRAF